MCHSSCKIQVYKRNSHVVFVKLTSCLSVHQILGAYILIQGKTMATDNSLLNQQSWLLKCVAIELRTLAVNRQRSHTQRLINLLLDDNPNQAHKSKSLSNYRNNKRTTGSIVVNGHFF